MRSTLFALLATLATCGAACAEGAGYEFRFTPEQATGEFGIPLALIGMSVVFSSLIAITLFIAALPKVLPFLNELLPPKAAHGHGVGNAPVAPQTDEAEQIAVAIGYALHKKSGR